jgi:hypothetical protein
MFWSWLEADIATLKVIVLITEELKYVTTKKNETPEMA